jgi:hypothetical protein
LAAWSLEQTPPVAAEARMSRAQLPWLPVLALEQPLSSPED